MQTHKPHETRTSILLKNMLSGALGACIAECVTIPIDQAKVRLQLQQTPPGMTPKYTGMVSTIYKIGAEESVTNLFRGLTPGLQR